MAARAKRKRIVWQGSGENVVKPIELKESTNTQAECTTCGTVVDKKELFDGQCYSCDAEDNFQV